MCILLKSMSYVIQQLLLDKYLGTIFHVINETVFHPDNLLPY